MDSRRRVDFDLEPIMEETYEEVVSLLRMPAHVPLLDKLPIGAAPGKTISDPATARSKERKYWCAAGQTSVAVAGISKLQRSITSAQLLKQDSIVGMSQADGGQRSRMTVRRPSASQGRSGIARVNPGM